MVDTNIFMPLSINNILYMINHFYWKNEKLAAITPDILRTEFENCISIYNKKSEKELQVL